MPGFITAAIIGTIVSAGAAAVAGTFAAFSFLSTFATYAILGAVSSVLAQQNQPNTGSGTIGSQGRLVTVRQPISYRQVIVGRARVGGTITYIEQVGSDLHMIITWAGHVCQSIDEIWFGDELQVLDGSGDATAGSYAETSFTETLNPTGTPPTATLAHTPIGAIALWLNDFATEALVPMTDVSPAEPDAATKYKLVGTTVTFYTGVTGVAVATYNVSTADVPPAGGVASYVRIQNSLGDEAGQPFPDLVTASAGKWTDAHRQTGCTKSYIRLTANPEKFPNGIPNITAVIKGALIYDPRTSPPASIWSANTSLWISHYLTNTDYGLSATYADEIDETDLVAGANVCDEQVLLAVGSPVTYENRYEANGAFLTSEAPKNVIGRLLGAMAGRAVAAGEKWHIHAGAYEVPTVTISEDDIVGPVRCQPIVSRRDSCNGVKGIFTDPNSSWQPTDFPPYPAPGSAYDTWIAQDNNERVWRDVDFSAFVTSGTQAQRLAKIELLRTRYALSETVPCKLTAYKAMTGRTIARTDTQMVWTAEPFDVIGSQFTVAGDGALGVELSLQRTAEAVYAWSTAEEQAVAVAGDPTLPDPYPSTGTPAGSVPSVTIAQKTVAGTSDVIGDQNVGGDQTVTGAVNGLTLTPLAVGFSIAGGTSPKTLTVDETMSVNELKAYAAMSSHSMS